MNPSNKTSVFSEPQLYDELMHSLVDDEATARAAVEDCMERYFKLLVEDPHDIRERQLPVFLAYKTRFEKIAQTRCAWENAITLFHKKFLDNLSVTIDEEHTSRATIHAEEKTAVEQLVLQEEESLRNTLSKEETTQFESCLVTLCVEHQGTLRLVRTGRLPSETVQFDSKTQTHQLHNIRVSSLLDSCDLLYVHAKSIASLADSTETEFKQQLGTLVKQIVLCLQKHKIDRKQSYAKWAAAKLVNKTKGTFTNKPTREHLDPLIKQGQTLLSKIYPPDIADFVNVHSNPDEDPPNWEEVL